MPANHCTGHCHTKGMAITVTENLSLQLVERFVVRNIRASAK
jgi:hypothetical protein